MSRLLASLLLASASAAAAPACATDADCSYNGVCAGGACACDPGWASNLDGANTLPLCSFLDFLPSPVSACGPACAFHGGPSSLDPSWTSWGMSVREEPGGVFHGFVAEMALECGLSAWTRGSQVVHATAPTPLGPFTRTSVVVAPWAHNPQVLRAPDGKYVLFTLGDGWAQNGPPLNCTGRPKDHGGAAARSARAAVTTGNCTPVPEPSNCSPGPCQRCNVTLHVADAPGAEGPWAPFPTAIIGLSAKDTIVRRAGPRCFLRARARARQQQLPCHATRARAYAPTRARSHTHTHAHTAVLPASRTTGTPRPWCCPTAPSR